jgi:hypothetical protein
MNTPNIIPRGTHGQTNKWTQGQIFTQYSGICSYSIGACIKIVIIFLPFNLNVIIIIHFLLLLFFFIIPVVNIITTVIVINIFFVLLLVVIVKVIVIDVLIPSWTVTTANVIKLNRIK